MVGLFFANTILINEDNPFKIKVLLLGLKGF